MWKSKLLAAAVAAASIGIAPLPASAAVSFSIDVAPPAPRYEVVPAPRAGFVWQPGVWAWRDGRHHWVAGHWIREHRGMYWHPDRWEQRDGHYVFERGRWDRERFAYRDNDHDGVPNRFDRAPNNPNRQ